MVSHALRHDLAMIVIRHALRHACITFALRKALRHALRHALGLAKAFSLKFPFPTGPGRSHVAKTQPLCSESAVFSQNCVFTTRLQSLPHASVPSFLSFEKCVFLMFFPKQCVA